MAVMDNKLRILYLMDIMRSRTDDSHMLNATELCEILQKEYMITADRRTIYSDMEILQKYGVDIQQEKGKNPGYYVGSREFELPELKLLVDAVQSSKFITENKSRQLIKKLEMLCSKWNADLLSKQVFIVNRPKAENETIYYNVDKIHTAIYEDKEITFQYAAWNPQKKLELKKDGAMYVTSPWSLTWDDENYYLVAYDAAAGIIKHYRVDKMQNISILETHRQGKEAFKNFDLAAFAKKTFGMYSGKDVTVSLVCANSLAGVVINRFGNDVWLVPTDKRHFRVKVTVTESPQFFGWVTAIGPQMRIEGPETVRKEYQKYLKTILQEYKDTGEHS